MSAGPSATTITGTMFCHPVCDEAVIHFDLAAMPRAPSLARRHAQAVLGAWKVSPHAMETAILMVSELVTNACAAVARTQARTSPRPSAAGAIGLTLRYQPGRIVIEVCDRDPDPPVVTEAGPDAESGRGLTLVQALSKEW